MQFFILFIVGAVIVGAGAMLSPAWPSQQPRIGAAGALSLALVIGGAVFWAELFGWNTLVIDYMFFALVSGVVLGGTLSHAQARAEAAGEEFSDSEQGWPGPHDLLFFALVIVLVTAPMLVLHLPPGRHAQISAYLAVTARDGATFNSLAPHYPEVQGIAAPGFQALTAYLSQQLLQTVPLIQMAVAAVVAFLCVLTAYDLGAEIQDKRLGRAMALTLIASLGIAGLYLNGFYPQLVGTLFGLSFVLYALRYYRHHLLVDMLAAGLMLGASLYVSPMLFVLLLLAYLLWLSILTLIPVSQEAEARWTWQAHFGLWGGVLLVALTGTAPWLLNNRGWLAFRRVLSLDFGLAAPRAVASAPHLWWLMLVYHGLWVLPVVLIGAFVAWRKLQIDGRQIVLLCVGWLLLVVDIAGIGLLPRLLPNMRELYSPAHYAWIGPIIPYTILGGFGGLWLYERLPQALRDFIRRSAYYLLAAAAVLLLGLLASPALIQIADDANLSPGVLASKADLAAMHWLHENAPEDARILNHPEEGLWAAPLLRQDVVFFPKPLMFAVPAGFLEDALVLARFWEDPRVRESTLREAGIDYVLVPQAVSTSYPLHFAEVRLIGGEDQIARLDFLDRVFERDGAAVYRLLPE